MPVIKCDVWILVKDFSGEGNDESKGLSDDSDDLKKSISDNFDCFSIGYLSNKVIVGTMTKGKVNLEILLFFFCFFTSAYKLK